MPKMLKLKVAAKVLIIMQYECENLRAACGYEYIGCQMNHVFHSFRAYVFGQLSSRTRHRVLALDKSLSIV